MAVEVVAAAQSRTAETAATAGPMAEEAEVDSQGRLAETVETAASVAVAAAAAKLTRMAPPAAMVALEDSAAGAEAAAITHFPTGSQVMAVTEALVAEAAVLAPRREAPAVPATAGSWRAMPRSDAAEAVPAWGARSLSRKVAFSQSSATPLLPAIP